MTGESKSRGTNFKRTWIISCVSYSRVMWRDYISPSPPHSLLMRPIDFQKYPYPDYIIHTPFCMFPKSSRKY